MIDVMSRLGEVKVKTAEALRASEADERASVVLVAVVREFDSKADKANRQANARDSVIELEQAGDSAKAAAEADPNLGESARQAVLDAHLAICILKTEILSGAFQILGSHQRSDGRRTVDGCRGSTPLCGIAAGPTRPAPWGLTPG